MQCNATGVSNFQTQPFHIFIFNPLNIPTYHHFTSFYRHYIPIFNGQFLLLCQVHPFSRHDFVDQTRSQAGLQAMTRCVVSGSLAARVASGFHGRLKVFDGCPGKEQHEIDWDVWKIRDRHFRCNATL